MSHTRWDYARLMRESGFRVTPQRQLILDAICAGGGHTTLDEIYARVRARSNAVNRATVYRTLDFLCRLRLVVAAEIGGRTVYEIAGDAPHHHVVCRVCGALEELNPGAMRALVAHVERQQCFYIDMDHLTLSGVCKRCYAAERRAGRDPVAHPPLPRCDEPAGKARK
jgi:Fur family ferric uptake transcriptional regulator